MTSTVAWAYLAFITYASLSPITNRPHLPSGSVRIEHLLAFALLGIVFVAAYPQRLVLVISVVLGSAVLLEYLQMLTPDRHGRLIDAVGKLIGGSLGIFVTAIILIWLKHA